VLEKKSCVRDRSSDEDSFSVVDRFSVGDRLIVVRQGLCRR